MQLSEEEIATCFKQGINCLDHGRYEEALKIFGMLLIGKPRNASLHYYKGNTLHKLKRYEEALESYKFKPGEGAYYLALLVVIMHLAMRLEGLKLYRKRYLPKARRFLLQT